MMKILKINFNLDSAKKDFVKSLSETGFAMLPGSNFGIDDEELITRIAFVDFDGEKALQHLKHNSKIKDSDFKTLFPKIKGGINKLKVWINQQKN